MSGLTSLAKSDFENYCLKNIWVISFTNISLNKIKFPLSHEN